MSELKERKSMSNWFSKHLNWSWAIFVIVIALLVSNDAVLYGLVGFFSASWGENGQITGSKLSFQLFRWAIGIIALISGSIFILKQKGRNAWLSVLCLLPLGFIVPWVLKNKEGQSKHELPKENILLSMDSTAIAQPDEIAQNHSDANVLQGKTKVCPYCHSDIPAESNWCPNCTSAL